jgi:hypothetical protein
MNDYEKQFFKYLKIKEALEDRQIIQVGGVVEKIRIGKHNIEYDIRSYNTKSIDLMAIATKKSDDKQPCFIMSITPGGSSLLTSISRGVACFEDTYDNSSDIVLAALEIARLKGAKTFEFTDNSTKTVSGLKLRLADLSFLTTGKTWYERILPIKPAANEEIVYIGRNRQLVLHNKWSDVYKELLKIGVEPNLNTEDIDVHAVGSAMKVLARAKKEKKNYLFFNNHMLDIIYASRVPTLQGVHWIMDI